MLYTRPCHEKKTFSGITELGVEAFMPTVKVFRQWHDRKKYVSVPLFPSYIFVYLSNILHYYNCLDVHGALGFVRFGKEIATVGAKVIEDIRLITGNTNDIEVSSASFAPGQQVYIHEGPLTGLSCEIVEIGKTSKALVRVTLLNRCLLVTLPAGSLIAAPAQLSTPIRTL